MNKGLDNINLSIRNTMETGTMIFRGLKAFQSCFIQFQVSSNLIKKTMISTLCVLVSYLPVVQILPNRQLNVRFVNAVTAGSSENFCPAV